MNRQQNFSSCSPLLLSFKFQKLFWCWQYFLQKGHQYFISFLFLLGYCFSSMGADVSSDGEMIKSGASDYPISVLVLHEDGQKEIHNSPEQFLSRLSKETLDSIHSLEEMFIHNKREEEQGQRLMRYEVFYIFYLNYLPVVILADKKGSGELLDGIDISSLKAQETLSFVFKSGTPESSAEKAIQLASKHGYSSQEKLNLFVRALHEKEVSDQDLMQMMSAWGIGKQRGIYMHDYKEYARAYKNAMNVEVEGEVEKSSPLFSSNSPSISSLLHEAFKAQRFLIFEALLQSGVSSSVDLNMPDYGGRSVLHLMSDRSWETVKPYFESFIRYQQMIDFDMQEYRGLTPLAYAIAHGDKSSLEWIKQLLAFKKKMRLDIVDNNQRTAFTLAAERFMPELAQLLHEQGVPRQTRVSADNVFIDADFRPFEFQTPLGVVFEDELVLMFDLDRERNNKEFSYHGLFKALMEKRISRKIEALQPYRGYFLLKFLSYVFEFEEQMRADFIMAALAEQVTGENEERVEESTRLLRAVWTGDLPFLQRFFSVPENKKKYLNSSFLSYEYQIQIPILSQLFSFFELRRYFQTDIRQNSEGNVMISMNNMNLLVEAVRFNQLEVVSFLLEAGASPIKETGSFGMRNALAAGILSGAIFLPYREQYQRHKKIMETLVAHSSVTTKLLQGQAVFGISYADLAAIRGSLSVLKLLYDKGVEISPALSSWNTRVSALDVAISQGFFGVVQFVLEQQLKKDPGNTEISRELKKCRRVFN